MNKTKREVQAEIDAARAEFTGEVEHIADDKRQGPRNHRTHVRTAPSLLDITPSNTNKSIPKAKTWLWQRLRQLQRRGRLTVISKYTR